MMYPDLSSYVSFLEQSNQLHRVSATVDKDTELACIARLSCDATESSIQPALLFEQVQNSTIPVLVGLYNTRERYASVLGCTPETILHRWSEAVAKPLEAQRLHDPIQRIHTVDDRKLTLLDLPVPTWTPHRDAGPYLSSAAVITKDPDTSIQNMAVYRVQIHNEDTCSVWFGSAHQHGAMHFTRWKKRNEDMPIALVIGGPPVIHQAAAAKTPYGIDELTIAGGLQKQAIPVQDAETVPLTIPAHTDILIEGYLQCDTTILEGPFGEALGYMSGTGHAPVMKVTSVSLKQNALFHGYVQQIPPSEGHLIWEYGVLGPLYHYLTSSMKIDTIANLAIVPGSAGLSTLVIQVSACTDEQIERIKSVLSKINFGQKFVLLVDEDIDLFDPYALTFALSSRVHPSYHCSTTKGAVYQLDPSVACSQQEPASTPPYDFPLTIIDARMKGKCAMFPLSLPPKRFMDNVAKRWDDFNLPPLKHSHRIKVLHKGEEP